MDTGAKKILIVEDEETLAHALEKKLTNEGYEVEVVYDGAAGLSQARKIKPDVLLLDILLPKLDGFGVLEALRKDDATKDMKVIIISNSGQPVEVERARKLGVKEYLIKADFTPQEVLEKVKRSFLGGKEGAMSHKSMQQEGSQASPAPTAGSAKGGKLILIVEDDKFLRNLLTAKLIKVGFQVVEAIDGEEGLAQMKASKPTLVLLDLVLPGIDGFEVLRRAKAEKEIAAIPIIILSNLGTQDDMKKGLGLGASDYIIKADFTPGEIVDKIREVLKGGGL